MVTIDELRNDSENMTVWQRHRFFVLIAIVVIISIVMVIVAFWLYDSSGSAQIDLSRPGYKSIQKEAKRDTVDDAFSSSGRLDARSFAEFDKKYQEHEKQVVDVRGFDPEALSEDNLGLFVTSN